ncbi:SoxR reducing system RseC family protein [Aurantimonas sp. A2-1-M11]|uniref:SoxR reducing system RseC family protein n=1 Tax=Aurantimonas sp. A2-1-M11 TaxID=3113712 RepID=UPI002F958748
MIEKRLVFVFPGFEPMPITAHMDRFARAAARSAPIWDARLAIEPTDRREASDAPTRRGLLRAELSGSDWRTHTDLVFCDWSDLILSYAGHSPLRRLSAGLVGLADFLFTGTVFRYARVSWRYLFFYLFPLVVIAAALLGGWLVAGLVAALLPLTGVAGVLVAGLAGLGAAWLVLMLADRRVHVLTAMDDWALARDLCRGRNPAIAQRIDEHAKAMHRAVAETQAGEIVIAAHSLGASLAVLALARALADGMRCDRPLHVLTVGSSLMKTALHPAASAQRQAVHDLVVTRRIGWTDCQGLSDPINFYRSNPARSLGIQGGETPIVVRIRFKRLVTPETYRRIKRDFFRLHRQFVLAVERRNAYSFHMLLLGPRPLADYGRLETVDLPPLSRAAAGPEPKP